MAELKAPPVAQTEPAVPPMEETKGADPSLPPAIERSFQIQSIDVREKALPIRPGDLTRLLLGQPGLTAEEQENLGRLGPLLGAVFHSEFYERIRELKELFAPLDPDSDYIQLPGYSRQRTEKSDEQFLPPFQAMMQRANYRQLDPKVIEDAVEAPNELGLTYQPDFNQFEHLKVYVRGYTQIPRVFRSLSTKFLKRTVWLDSYQRMVVLLKFKPDPKLDSYVRSDVIYLRMFKDVPHVDMEMHLPEQGTRVKMRWIDKAQIASPMMTGLPMMAYKLITAIALSPWIFATMMIAPIMAGINSFFGFQRAKHKHLSSMIRNLYYLTLANNTSVLTRVVDSAEEEEYKETMLAYFFLWRATAAGETLSRKDLDQRIEVFMSEVAGTEINFEISDALGKLFRLGLADRDENDALRVLPIDQALVVLDQRWDNVFTYA